MDRIMTVEERIRRAEDIYNRRNGGYSGVVLKNKEKKKNKNKKSNVKRLFMQIFICLFVYIIFYAVSNKEYVFSEEFRKEVNTFFTEKIKISEFYYKAREFMDSKFNTPIEENIEETKEKNEEENKEKQNVEEIKEKQKESKEENIGGSIEDKQEEQTSESKDNISEQDLMEKNAAEIKEKISFILPVNGRISSTFGWRNPTTITVPKYHTGIDIAAKEGTVIKAATKGKIIMASEKGDYGNHYQIQVEDVILVYAHCKKLYLKEGDTVRQGQEIAEVGTTGNSTGPHLHFEIRKGNYKIDPQLILNF